MSSVYDSQVEDVKVLGCLKIVKNGKHCHSKDRKK